MYQYVQMYQKGVDTVEIYHRIVTETNFDFREISKWFTKVLKLPEDSIPTIQSLAIKRIDTKYHRLKKDNGLDAEQIFRIAYVDMKERRVFTIGILMRVFDLNINDATGIAWATLYKIDQEQNNDIDKTS